MKSSLYLKEVFEKCEFPAINKKPDDYKNRLTGALAGRFAGCTLGVLVENYPIEKMLEIAKKDRHAFSADGILARGGKSGLNTVRHRQTHVVYFGAYRRSTGRRRYHLHHTQYDFIEALRKKLHG